MQNSKDKINLLLGETLIKQAKIKALEEGTNVSEFCRIILSTWQSGLFGIAAYNFTGKKEIPHAPGIYFIVQQDKIIYIGQSIDIKKRLCGHSKKEYLNRDTIIFWFEVDQSLLDGIENICIDILQPPLNVQGMQTRVPISLRVDPQTDAAVRRLASDLGLSQSEVVDMWRKFWEENHKEQ